MKTHLVQPYIFPLLTRKLVSSFAQKLNDILIVYGCYLMKGKFKSGLKHQQENKTGGLCMSWCIFCLVASINRIRGKNIKWIVTQQLFKENYITSSRCRDSSHYLIKQGTFLIHLAQGVMHNGGTIKGVITFCF